MFVEPCTHFTVTQKSTGHAKQLSFTYREIFSVLDDRTVQFIRQCFDFVFHVSTLDGLPNNVVVILLKRVQIVPIAEN